VPAASVNFYCVPLDKQVLYMSCCGVLWTAYLSYASANAVGKAPEPPAQPQSQAQHKQQKRQERQEPLPAKGGFKWGW
jgi:hypothetical protein